MRVWRPMMGILEVPNCARVPMGLRGAAPARAVHSVLQLALYALPYPYKFLTDSVKPNSALRYSTQPSVKTKATVRRQTMTRAASAMNTSGYILLHAPSMANHPNVLSASSLRSR